MEQNSKNSLPFENELFNQTDIALINEKVEENIPILFSNEHYMKIDEKLLDLTETLESLLNSPELEIFKKYVKINTDAINYQNCLAYYLGLQSGIKINELK